MKKNTFILRQAKPYLNYLIVFFVYVAFKFLFSTGTINSYWNQIIILSMVNGIVAMSLNLVNGITGQFSMGHAGFMSVGAYISAFLTTKIIHGVTPGTAYGLLIFLFALIIGGLVAALIGLLIGIPSLRLKGDYLAIITLGFSEIIRTIWRVTPFSGGARGLSGIPKMTNYTTAFIVVFIIMILLRNYTASNYGRGSLAVRENELAAETMGVNTTAIKIKSFVFSAFIAGIAGGLYSHLLVFIQPNMFSQVKSTDMLLYLYAGGVGSYTSALLGSLTFTILPEFLRFMGEWRLVIYALVMILIMIYRPKGIFGKYEFGFMRLGHHYVKDAKNLNIGLIADIGKMLKIKHNKNGVG